MGYDKGERKRGYARSNKASSSNPFHKESSAENERGKRERQDIDSSTEARNNASKRASKRASHSSSRGTSHPDSPKLARSGLREALYYSGTTTLVVQDSVSKAVGVILLLVGVFGVFMTLVWSWMLATVVCIILFAAFGYVARYGLRILRSRFKQMIFHVDRQMAFIGDEPIPFSDFGHLEIHAPKGKKGMTLELWHLGESYSVFESKKREDLLKLGTFIQRKCGISFLGKT